MNIKCTPFFFLTEYGVGGTKKAVRVSMGWIPGRYMDLSDHQWRMLRQYSVLLVVGLSGFVLLSQWVKRRSKTVQPILFYYIITSMLVVFFLHGFDLLWLLFISLVNFLFAKLCGGSRWTPALCWIWNVSMLFLGDYYGGFKGVFTFLGFPLLVTAGLLKGVFIFTQDKFHGVSGWHIYFKMTLLRHLSYSMDYYWMRRKKPIMDLKGRSVYTVAQETHQPESR